MFTGVGDLNSSNRAVWGSSRLTDKNKVDRRAELISSCGCLLFFFDSAISFCLFDAGEESGPDRSLLGEKGRVGLGLVKYCSNDPL